MGFSLEFQKFFSHYIWEHVFSQSKVRIMLVTKYHYFLPLLLSKLTMPLGKLSYIAFPVIMINILNLYGLVCVSALFSFPVYLLIYILYESTLQYTEFSMTTPCHMVIQLWIIKKCCLLNYPTVNCFIYNMHDHVLFGKKEFWTTHVF